MDDWSPGSWQSRPIRQAVTYPDCGKLERVLQELAALPPLVTSWDVESLKSQLSAVQQGQAFLLQGGDCAERFDDCRAAPIVAKLKILLQMSLVLAYGTGRRVIRVGRFGGQYAKPRSSDVETRDGVTMPSYRGDMINRPEFDAAARVPDPQLLLTGYERAAMTLNFIRSLVGGGFADLHHPEWWNLDFAGTSSQAGDYQWLVNHITESLAFLEAVAGRTLDDVCRTDFYTSHEGLLLDYEQALTRQVPRRPGWYDLSTHFPWIGYRTGQPSGAHVEFFRGVANPVAVKIGPGIAPEELLELIQRLDPDNEPGRLTLTHRFGAARIEAQLPGLVEAVRRADRKVLWCCDPMHGNTISTATGRKTRRFGDVMSELQSAFEIHAAADSSLGGIHVEVSGDVVTECVGGAGGLSEGDLERAYESEVDPRLNYEQALELSLLVAGRLRKR
ncbi:MAG: 3-deoxy-7-phosphoheptulonate synthase class II [Candidatus Riflebacteria bacterium]|nr:3-deoxy-7-phosphoheptulonate synthase class II [Candidatus Riflebacteria bacterium]